MESLILAQDER